MKGIILIIIIGLLIIGVIYIQRSQKESAVSPTEQLEIPDRARDQAAARSISAIISGIKSYYITHQQYPSQLDQLVPAYIRATSDLVDPWGTKFKLNTNMDGELTIVSAGKDRSFETADDIKQSM